MSRNFAYVCGWTHGDGEGGLGAYELDPASGKLQFIGMECTDIDFGMSFYDPIQKLLYVCNECVDLPGLQGGGGRVFAFRVDENTGKLCQVSAANTWCPNPSYIAKDRDGHFAVVTNHSGKGVVTKIQKDAFGNYYPDIVHDDAVIELFELQSDGSIGELVDVVYQYGNGPDRRQQGGPHPHCVARAPFGDFFAVCDKGNDTISVLQIDSEKKKLKPVVLPVRCEPGCMPRYGVFHPAKPWFYHNCEHSDRLFCYSYDESGQFNPLGDCDIRPQGYGSESSDAPILQQGLSMHPSGQYLYDIVRGPNGIVICAVDGKDGSLRTLDFEKIPDGWPRGCSITEDGQYLGVCGMENGAVFIYRIKENGCLTLCDTVAQEHAAFISFTGF